MHQLAPALSQKFNINLTDLENFMNGFLPPVGATHSGLASTAKREDPKDPKAPKAPKDPKAPKAPKKDELLKEARALGLNVSTKMKKDQIQAVLLAAAHVAAPGAERSRYKTPRSRSPSPGPSGVARPKRQCATKPAKTEPKPAKTEPKPAKTKSHSEGRTVGSLEGKTFTSTKNKEWTFGKLLGAGGFGFVYEVEGNPDLVIKTRSDALKKDQDSGLFLEKSIYHKLKDPKGDEYGIPQMVDSGKLPKELKTNDYFIVLPRFEISLDNIAGTLTPQDKKNVVNDVLDALNYLSKNKSYLHLDIKAENIMRKNGRWFLIDYGIAERFTQTSETTPNLDKAGNGTIRYMARDAHNGLMSRKADLESLVYTLVEMEGHKLPWHREKMKREKDKDYIQYVLKGKQEFFDTSYKDLDLPQYYNTFIEYVNQLQPGTKPKYNVLKFK